MTRGARPAGGFVDELAQFAGLTPPDISDHIVGALRRHAHRNGTLAVALDDLGVTGPPGPERYWAEVAAYTESKRLYPDAEAAATLRIWEDTDDPPF